MITNTKPAARIRYDGVNSFADLKRLIDEGETEDIFRECKAPVSPQVTKDVKIHLQIALSGFSNSEGGILLYGVATSKHEGGADVMVDIPKVGNVNSFAARITNSIPTLTIPAITNFDYKIIKSRSKDTAGVLIVYVPQTQHPVQTSTDKKFYFRGGDQFVDAPYSTLERLFLASEAPDIDVELDNHRIINSAEKRHSIDITLRNKSVAVGRDTELFMRIMNSENTELIKTDMTDASRVNYGSKSFTHPVTSVMHYRFGIVVANLEVVMKGQKQKLIIRFTVYADKMMPKKCLYTCRLTGKSFKVIKKEIL